MATKVYKAAHTGSGHYGKIVEVINTDSAGVGANALALHLGSTCIYKKTMAFDNSGIKGYIISTSDDPQYLEPWLCILTPPSGYQALPWNTKVLMAGVDITDSVYDKSTGTISISSVTGDISIEAEAVEALPAQYTPIEYIECHTQVGNGGFETNIRVNERSKVEVIMLYKTSGSRIIVDRGKDAGASTTTFLCYGYYSSNLRFIWNKKVYGGIHEAPNSTKYKIVMSRDELARYTYDNGWHVSEIYKVEDQEDYDAEFTSTRNLCLLGNRVTVASGSILGTIWRARHFVDGVLTDDYIPCIDNTNQRVGMYNNVDKVFLYPNQSAWIAPHVITTRNYTGCAATLLSAAITGTAARAVIGSTWSIKISPSSGYTFVGGTTPQVLIDGVDVTSQVVSDNGDGTYNVTIANVEDKPIEITALAVSDGTTNATNSVTPMGGNTENNEEEM